MIFERVTLSVLFLVSVLVVLEAPGVKGAMAGMAITGAELKPLCGYGETTGH